MMMRLMGIHLFACGAERFLKMKKIGCEIKMVGSMDEKNRELISKVHRILNFF